MARHYSTRDFFRQMPNALLARYFADRNVLAGLDFATEDDMQPDALFRAWLDLPEARRNAMDAELRDISEMSCEKGWCAIRDEAAWQLGERPDQLGEFVEKLSALASHYERAMVTFLDGGPYWKGATHFYHADTLTYWKKRRGLPQGPASVHEDGRRELASRISRYFQQTEGRGRNCIVEAFRRKGQDYFFAYPEDYSQQSVEWENGMFARRPHNPAFDVIFVYCQKEGTLDLNFRGSPKAIDPLQGMFAEAILKLLELPPDPKDERVYDLNPLAERGFQFVYSPGSSIERVVVKKLRLSSKLRSGDRITLEADSARDARAIYDLLDQLGRSLSLRLYSVTMVELSATIRTAEDQSSKRVAFRITHPNSCSLKYDDTGLHLREMLVASGIEPREPAQALLTAEEPEPAEA